MCEWVISFQKIQTKMVNFEERNVEKIRSSGHKKSRQRRSMYIYKMNERSFGTMRAREKSIAEKKAGMMECVS